MNPADFMNRLKELCFENTFNPYRDRCSEYDLSDAPQRREQMLLSLLTAARDRGVDSMWIGQELGHLGGRRTGLALTDDIYFDMHLERWGLSCDQPTKNPVVAECTASIVWGLLAQIREAVFLWNVFPLHMHKPGNSFSNRQDKSADEREAGEKVLSDLILLLKPGRLIALGNEAHKVTKRVAQRSPYQYDVRKVRHPSRNGQMQFLREMQEIYLSAK